MTIDNFPEPPTDYGTMPIDVEINDNVDSIDLETALDEVSVERRAYALHYRFERDRRLSVAVYLLLKKSLQRKYGLTGNPRLAKDARGKPYLADHPNIHFNFSHCPGVAACAVSDAPVGLDVEKITPVDMETARQAMSPAELAAIADSAEPEVLFSRFWTMKEALVKLRGSGISDATLPRLLEQTKDVEFETAIRRQKGFVLSVARYTDRNMTKTRSADY